MLTETILSAIREADKAGRVLTVREIQAQCRVSSTSVVRYHMLRLEKQGYLTMGPKGHSRAYALTDKGRGYPSDAELLSRCMAYIPHETALRRAIEERLAI